MSKKSKDRLCGIRDLIWSNECVPLLSPRDACSLQPNTSMAEILVMVPSGSLNFERRATIRDSWAKTPLVREGKIKVIFVLGLFRLFGTNLGASQVLSYQRYQMRLFCWVPWIMLLAFAQSSMEVMSSKMPHQDQGFKRLTTFENKIMLSELIWNCHPDLKLLHLHHGIIEQLAFCLAFLGKFVNSLSLCRCRTTGLK